MELGHIPVMGDYLDLSEKGGELLLQKIIEECDYFVALVAHKYVPSSEKNCGLEAEYNFAAKKNIPVISLIIDERARWKASKREGDAELAKKLEDFKEKLRTNLCETWLNSTDLCHKFQNLLIKEMNLNPKNGWVRADQAVTPYMANELSRLSAENEQLRRNIKTEDTDIVSQLQEQTKQVLKVLALNKVTLSFYYTTGENWENSRQFRYIRIFKLLVPELTVGKTTSEISRFLGTVLNPDLEKIVRKDYPTPSNTIKKIMADFLLLKLVKYTSSKENPGEEVWEITEYGKELYSAYRLRQLEEPFAKKE